MNNCAISLFSGIGGLDIGFSAAGYNIIAQVEIDTFCQRILKRHAPEWWPNATIFSDVRDFGRKDITGDIEIMFGGFPCQPHSVAGKRLGAEDDRNLWPEFRRIIGEFRPRSVLLENVPGILTGYAVSIVGDLTALGYDCSWGTIRAFDTGAPHKRERWFCMAYDDDQRQLQSGRVIGNIRRRITHSDQTMANTKSTRPPERRHRQIQNNCQVGKASEVATDTRFERSGGFNRAIASKSRLDRKHDGIPPWLDEPRWPAGQGTYQHEWEAPRTVGKGIDPHRSARIKALGNAVLPQIAYQIACAMRLWSTT